MSLFLRERALFGIEPDRVSAIRLRRSGLGLKVAAVIDIAAADGLAGSSEAALRVLAELLAQPEWQGVSAEVVLSNHFARHAVVPGSASLRNQQERHALAEAVFRDIYGPLAQDWEILADRTSLRAAAVASAVPRALLSGLREAFGQTGRLRSVQPLFVRAFNLAARSIGASPCAIAVLERGRLTVGCMEQAGWRSIFSRAVPPDDASALRRAFADAADAGLAPRGGKLWLATLAGALALGDAWSVAPLVPPLAGEETHEGRLPMAAWAARAT